MISSKEYKNFVNSLNKLVPFFDKMNLRDSKKRDIRINKYLIYRIKMKIENKKLHNVAEFHIKSTPPNILRDVLNLKECVESFVDNSENILNNTNVYKIKCTTHNRLITNFVYERLLKPKLINKGFKVNLEEGNIKYLVCIYCEFILVNGIDYLFTEKGYKELKKINKVVVLTVKKI